MIKLGEGYRILLRKSQPKLQKKIIGVSAINWFQGFLGGRLKELGPPSAKYCVARGAQRGPLNSPN